MHIQSNAASALAEAVDKGEGHFVIEHPRADLLKPQERVVARVSITVAEDRNGGTPTDDVIVEAPPEPRWADSDLWWAAATRILISIAPPEQGWDAFGSSFSTIGEPGAWSARVDELRALVADGVLEESQPGHHAHYVHREHLAGQTIDGRAARAMCGVFFVPCQDHETLERCPSCEAELERLPRR